MLSKLRKYLRFAPQFFTVLGAVSMAVAMLLSVVNVPVSGQAADTCPVGNGWTKVDVGDKPNFQYTAPDGKLVAEWCYKAGFNDLVFGDVNPPQKQVSLTSKFQQGISHASFRLVSIPTNTSVPPTFTPSNTPTNTPVAPTFTPSNTPTNTPTNTPVTPTNTATNTPTNTPIPDDPGETPTPVTSTPTSTVVPNTATPVNTQPPATPTATVTEEPKDPGPTATPVTDETPDPTEPPVTDETPDPTEPPVTDETPEPTLAPPVSNDPPTVLIPVTGIELGGNSPLSDAQNFIFNMGLSFLGLGLVLQSVRKRFNF